MGCASWALGSQIYHLRVPAAHPGSYTAPCGSRGEGILDLMDTQPDLVSQSLSWRMSTITTAFFEQFCSFSLPRY